TVPPSTNATVVNIFSLTSHYQLCWWVPQPQVIVSNTCVIVVICMNRSLHEPMYLFLCSLFVNELYGSTALFPFLLIQVEICNLAVMSYDRYVAICCPLQYNRRMTTLRALVFITVVWLYCFVRVLITVALNLRLTLCGNFIDKVRCANYPIVKLACSDTTVNNIYGLFGTVLSVVLPLFPMLFSYVMILKVCFSGSKQTRQKALSTCSPQLVSLINFSFGYSKDLLVSVFPHPPTIPESFIVWITDEQNKKTSFHS
uniref:G-protein coupled receptors family 1 profile domain-containing protein n=1 Tax=Cynoglossus semilaevis TaxID=244447 RepID=A0A3P8V5U8_CYNSE